MGLYQRGRPVTRRDLYNPPPKMSRPTSLELSSRAALKSHTSAVGACVGLTGRTTGSGLQRAADGLLTDNLGGFFVAAQRLERHLRILFARLCRIRTEYAF